ncbi:WD40 repeat-like protein [Epithele typhae]|uniref:WD40 repeat-like protein n=1 Tax=Epithele typhae TaxID=378194 RepID=UPI002007E257|nr:WD40 repeat-like protein [Epithele typhae]KAH9915195.1 WD40 repeat-like protein [Epithele typhae]
MPDAFFASSKNRKRKRSSTKDAGPSTSKKMAHSAKGKLRKPAPAKKRTTGDEELSDETQDDDQEGIDQMDLRAPEVDPNAYESGEEDEDETPAQKRLRLAKLYLEGVKQGLSLADGEFDAAEIDRELVSARLKQDVMEHSGKMHLLVAGTFDLSVPSPSLRTKHAHRCSVTAAVASHDARWLFTAGKEGSIVKWDLRTGKQAHGKSRDTGDVQGHTDEVWALALSPDGKYLASGGKDRRVGVWDVEKDAWVKGFGGHRDSISVSSLGAASTQTPTQLYSGSYDRTLKLFDLTTMGYVETLFGHQAPVLALDVLRGETATVRYWKVPEETQLVFRGGGRSKLYDDLDLDGGDEAEKAKAKGKDSKAEKFVEGSIECVAMIDETTFVSGAIAGMSISLWSTQRKKPVYTQALAHSMDLAQVEAEKIPTIRQPRWVTALASLRYSDLFASGSWDGEVVRTPRHIPVLGVVNTLQLVPAPKDFFAAAAWAAAPSRLNGDDAEPEPHPQANGATVKAASRATPVLLVAGVGQEMRAGRWISKKGEGCVNGAAVFALHPRT